jgi:hypothetical protein
MYNESTGKWDHFVVFKDDTSEDGFKSIPVERFIHDDRKIQLNSFGESSRTIAQIFKHSFGGLRPETPEELQRYINAYTNTINEENENAEE